MPPLIHEDYFAGIGGFTKASSELGIPTVKFIEIDKDAQKTLRSNFPGVPIHEDIRTHNPTPGANLYTIGFPCTGTSVAGSRTGLAHQESSLWFEALRCIHYGKPTFVVLENPDGLIDRGLRAVLGSLRMAGYTFDNPQIVSAAELGAGHQRKRVFIVSYPERLRFKEQPLCWTDQIRDSIQKVRTKAEWLLLERSSNGINPRFPDGLDNVPLNVRRGTAGRIRSRFLFGRCVTPPQATIPLLRVQYLHSLIKH
jgi:DNA (cytosine-5)-methyltransferase 1